MNNKTTGGRKAVVTLKITLLGLKPPIWRRITAPGSMTLGELSDTILTAMGWQGSHLHAFDIDRRDYGDTSITDDVLSERRVTLNSLVKQGVKRFRYVYDFGDGWDHAIAVEKVEMVDSTLTLARGPTCVAGKRACPPEDSGGPWGFGETLAILADPQHPEYEERRDWLDEDFDPLKFDVAQTNGQLAWLTA